MAKQNSKADSADQTTQASAGTDAATGTDASSTSVDPSGIINTHSGVAAAAALVPVPGLDLVTLVGIQAKMVHSIGQAHGQSLNNNKLKVAITSLITAAPASTFSALGASALKLIPGLGTVLGALASPAYFGASTYAVGKIFHMHFASGGNLLNFDADAVKDHYQGLVDEKTEEKTAAA
ncbi:MAG: DUF697 domain-containing protein [Cytophagales bacterium]|nr:DUF697 domain-containing protein [Cytophagales bacterium]